MNRTSTLSLRIAALVSAALLLSPAPGARAQRDIAAETLSPLLAGTTLPVELQHGLRAGKTTPGTHLLARTIQRVPVGPHQYLKRGAVVSGEVEASTAGDGAAGAILRLRFDTLSYRGKDIHLAVEAVAIANFTAVAETRVPASGSTDRGNPSPASWTTRQVGGDEVYRSGWSGKVCDRVMRTVGFADYDGVYRLAPAADAVGTPPFPTALGAFSADASGLYGYPDAVSLHSAEGHITLSGPAGRVGLHQGDQILLRVLRSP